MDHGKSRGPNRSRVAPEAIDLGNEPPLSVDGGSGGIVDRRRVSVQWFSGTILTGVCGAALMGGAVFASLDGETNFATVPERVEAALRQTATGIADRPTGAVKFFFATQKSPEVIKNFGSHLAAPRTGAAARSDQRACHEAFLWTLINLEKRAQRVGANAVVNIVSYYRRKERARATEFECHVGNVIVTVWLKGDLVKIAE